MARLSVAILLVLLSITMTASQDSSPPSPGPEADAPVSPSPSPFHGSPPSPSPFHGSSSPNPPPSDPAPASPPSPAPSPSSEQSPTPGNDDLDGGVTHADNLKETQKKESGMSAGKKVGIAFGVIAGLCVVGLAGFVYKKRQQNIERSKYGYGRREIPLSSF